MHSGVMVLYKLAGIRTESLACVRSESRITVMNLWLRRLMVRMCTMFEFFSPREANIMIMMRLSWFRVWYMTILLAWQVLSVLRLIRAITRFMSVLSGSV